MSKVKEGDLWTSVHCTENPEEEITVWSRTDQGIILRQGDDEIYIPNKLAKGLILSLLSAWETVE